MFRRTFLIAAIALLASTTVLAQRQQQTQPRVTTELVVRVTYEDDRAVVDQIRVQLSNSSGIPIAESFTRGEGEARFIGIEPGAYRLRVSGMEIEEKVSDYSFTINPREMNHMEFIRVRKRNTGQATSTQGHISAAALNVPPKAESEFDKGVAALRKQDNAQAQKRFNRALELYPRYAAAYNNLGVIAMQEGNPGLGKEFFEKAVKVDDQYAPPYLNLAKVVATKDYNAAKGLLQKAASLDPSNVETIAILAMLEYETNQLPLALSNARRVHTMPDHERFAFAHYVAGRTLESQKLPREALVEYRIFLKEAPMSPSVPKVKGFIEAIEQQTR
ncbi:MAG TPA: tetratricopeptide repeat protein [Terriglobales bacterium]|nr:tetratricopeptide repeat protein [Terriglobales bacterium]